MQGARRVATRSRQKILCISVSAWRASSAEVLASGSGWAHRKNLTLKSLSQINDALAYWYIHRTEVHHIPIRDTVTEIWDIAPENLVAFFGWAAAENLVAFCGRAASVEAVVPHFRRHLQVVVRHFRRHLQVVVRHFRRHLQVVVRHRRRPVFYPYYP